MDSKFTNEQRLKQLAKLLFSRPGRHRPRGIERQQRPELRETPMGQMACASYELGRAVADRMSKT